MTKASEIIKIYNCDAGVAELADAQDLKLLNLGINRNPEITKG
ncbi:hypothetical protein [Caldicellulosiruptor acetigenus]|nr:hypothetical protein [Caldicellulosiruptor acetigenus]